MKKDFIERQRAILITMADRLNGVPTKLDKFTGSGDFADLSSEITEVEQSLSASANRRQIGREISVALRKIDAGTYGVCEATGKFIGTDRLKAIPWARFSIEAQAELEKSHCANGRGPANLFEQVVSDEDAEEADEVDLAAAETTKRR